MKSNPTRRRAFTVLELIVVMTIVFILLGLAVPAYQSAIKGNAPLSGATQLAGDLAFARQNAITTHNPTAVIFSDMTVATNEIILSRISYAILQQTNGAWSYLDRWHSLPRGAFFVVLPSSSGTFPFPTNNALGTANGVPYIQFESTGEANVGATNVVMEGLMRKNGAGIVTLVNSNVNNVITGIVYRTTGLARVLQ